jgi:hypothetical protein
MSSVMDILIRLRPVTFTYKKEIDTTQELHYGLIAEEVETISKELVLYKDGHPETVKCNLLPILLLKAIQELTIKNRQLADRIMYLETHDQ